MKNYHLLYLVTFLFAKSIQGNIQFNNIGKVRLVDTVSDFKVPLGLGKVKTLLASLAKAMTSNEELNLVCILKLPEQTIDKRNELYPSINYKEQFLLIQERVRYAFKKLGYVLTKTPYPDTEFIKSHLSSFMTYEERPKRSINTSSGKPKRLFKSVNGKKSSRGKLQTKNVIKKIVSYLPLMNKVAGEAKNLYQTLQGQSNNVLQDSGALAGGFTDTGEILACKRTTLVLDRIIENSLTFLNNFLNQANHIFEGKVPPNIISEGNITAIVEQSNILDHSEISAENIIEEMPFSIIKYQEKVDESCERNCNKIDEAAIIIHVPQVSKIFTLYEFLDKNPQILVNGIGYEVSVKPENKFIGIGLTKNFLKMNQGDLNECVKIRDQFFCKHVVERFFGKTSVNTCIVSLYDGDLNRIFNNCKIELKEVTESIIRLALNIYSIFSKESTTIQLTDSSGEKSEFIKGIKLIKLSEDMTQASSKFFNVKYESRSDFFKGGSNIHLPRLTDYLGNTSFNQETLKYFSKNDIHVFDPKANTPKGYLKSHLTEIPYYVQFLIATLVLGVITCLLKIFFRKVDKNGHLRDCVRDLQARTEAEHDIQGVVTSTDTELQVNAVGTSTDGPTRPPPPY